MPWNPEQLSWLPEASQRLLRFVCTRMVHSYKPVLTRILLDRLPNLRVPLAEVQDEFVAFYQEREAAGLPVERRGSSFMRGGSVEPEAARCTAEKVLRNVFQENGYVNLYPRLVEICPPEAWEGLTTEPALSTARRLLQEALSDFYKRIEVLGEAVYGRAMREDRAGGHEVVFLLSDPDDSDDLFIV